MLNKSLFEIISNYHILIDEVVENDGEITPEIEEALVINKEEVEQKITDYYRIIKMLESNKTIIEDEINRLKQKTQVIENTIERLKNNVKIAVETFGEITESGGSRLKLPLVNCWTVKTKPVVLEEGYDEIDIDNPEVAYREYKVRVPCDKESLMDDFCSINFFARNKEYKIDKKVAKNILTMGGNIEGLKIDYEASYVRMK